jgi:hypothetical protein
MGIENPLLEPQTERRGTIKAVAKKRQLQNLHLIDKEGKRKRLLNFFCTPTMLQWLQTKLKAVLKQGCQIFLFKHTKPGKMYKMLRNYTKWQLNVPNGIKILSMVIKYTYIFYSKALQTVPELGFFGTKINHHLAALF